MNKVKELYDILNEERTSLESAVMALRNRGFLPKKNNGRFTIVNGGTGKVVRDGITGRELIKFTNDVIDKKTTEESLNENRLSDILLDFESSIESLFPDNFEVRYDENKSIITCGGLKADLSCIDFDDMDSIYVKAPYEYFSVKGTIDQEGNISNEDEFNTCVAVDIILDEEPLMRNKIKIKGNEVVIPNRGLEESEFKNIVKLLEREGFEVSGTDISENEIKFTVDRK